MAAVLALAIAADEIGMLRKSREELDQALRGRSLHLGAICLLVVATGGRSTARKRPAHLLWLGASSGSQTS